MNTDTCPRTDVTEPVLFQHVPGRSEIVVESSGHPFILDFLVPYIGAINPTTTGTWDNRDGSDYT